MDSKLYPQGSRGVKTKEDGNTLTFYDKNGLVIAVFDGDNRTISVPTGSSVSGAGAVTGAVADDLTLETTTDIHIKDAGITAAKLGTALAGSVDGLGFLHVARATFDPSAVAGQRTAAPHGLGVSLPDKAIIVGGFVDVITTFQSTAGGTDKATIALSAEGANDLVSAVAIETGTPWDAGRQAIIPDMTAAKMIRTTAAREITATVAVAALTAGKLIAYVFYVQSA